VPETLLIQSQSHRPDLVTSYTLLNPAALALCLISRNPTVLIWSLPTNFKDDLCNYNQQLHLLSQSHRPDLVTSYAALVGCLAVAFLMSQSHRPDLVTSYPWLHKLCVSEGLGGPPLLPREIGWSSFVVGLISSSFLEIQAADSIQVAVPAVTGVPEWRFGGGMVFVRHVFCFSSLGSVTTVGLPIV
jgi:hypothetical protein